MGAGAGGYRGASAAGGAPERSGAGVRRSAAQGVGVWRRALPAALGAAVSLWACACGAPSFTVAQRASDHQAASALIADLAAGRTVQAETAFSPAMHTALPAAKLRAAWNDEVSAHGALVSQGAPSYQEASGDLVVDTALQMRRGPITARVTFDRSGAVVGLFFLHA